MSKRALVIGLVAVVALIDGTVSAAVAPVKRGVVSTATAGEVASAAQRVYMVTDSVGLGVKTALASALPEYQVTVDGTPALFVEQLLSKWVDSRVGTAVLGDVAIVAGGYNYPYWDPARFDRSIDSMVTGLRAAGVKHVIWVTLREVKPQYITAGAWDQVQPYYWYFPSVNEHLRSALDRFPDLTLADWAAIADQPGLTYDAIHLNPVGAALYSSMLAGIVRNVSTRLDVATTTKVTVAGINGVPANAKAVAVNLTVTIPRAPGFVTAYPCGIPRPATSNLNYRSDQTVAVSAIVNVGENQQICVFNSDRTHVIVDVEGFFAADSGYHTLAPTRLIDTRVAAAPVVYSGAAPLVVAVAGVGGVPGDAAGVALNVTITDNTANGFAAAYPCDAAPAVPIALVNYIPNTATPNFTIAKPAADGTICISTSTPASVVVDAFGYFPAGSPVSVTTPTRLVDTRLGGARLPGGTELVVPILGGARMPAAAAAAVLSVTAASPAGVGYVVAYPCGTASGASTLNVVSDRGTTNTAIVAPGTGGAVCVRSNVDTHILIDVSTWILAGYVGLTPWRAFDSRLG